MQLLEGRYLTTERWLLQYSPFAVIAKHCKCFVVHFAKRAREIRDLNYIGSAGGVECGVYGGPCERIASFQRGG
jgi:hypothetical protein